MATITLPGGTVSASEGMTVTRIGYGGMKLARPGIFGTPKDREAVKLGIASN